MAIDTEQKRRSAGSHPVLTVYPVPSGNVDTADKPHAAWVYRGIAVALIRLEIVRVVAFINTQFRRVVDL